MVRFAMVKFSVVVDMGPVELHTANQGHSTQRRSAQKHSVRGFVTAYTIILFAIAALLLVSLDSRVVPPLSGGTLTMVFLLAASVLVNAFPVHVRVGRELHSFMLHELALVVAVLTLPARFAVLVLVLGATIARLGIQHLAKSKVVFNVAVTAIEVAMVASALHALAPGRKVTDTATWVAVLAGTIISNVVSVMIVTGVIRLSGGKISALDLLRNASLGIIGGVAMASIAIVGVVLTVVNIVSIAFTFLIGVACFLAYRRHVELRERYNAMLRLERFTRALAPDRSVETIIDKLLHHAAELMNTEDASISLATLDGRLVLARSLSDAQREIPETCPTPGDPIWVRAHTENKAFRVIRNASSSDSLVSNELGDLHASDLVVAPLRLDEHNVGVLIGRNQRNSLLRMSAADLDLVTTMAHHASVILERSRLFEQLDQEMRVREYQATHDSLTGLLNRPAFNTAADTYLASDSATTSLAAVMLVDLNQFKNVNDTMGHHAGDDVLVQIGSRLVGALPLGSTVARLGGDEFAVLIPGVVTPEAALLAAAGLRDAINLPVTVDDVTFTLDAAIGVSFAPTHGTDRHTLLKRADIAMYAAKDRRSTPVAIYDPSQQRWTAQEIGLSEDLRHAVEDEKLWVAFQPKTSLKSGQVVGVEALCRWTHAIQGPIRPDIFIRLAEQSGLIDAITEFVLSESLRQCRAWLDEGLSIGIAVNIPARSLSDPTLPSRIKAHAVASSVPPRMLTLEVTEGELMEDARTSRAVMTELRALGFRVSIDDFGTGYSSLAYLHTLPVDELKIDRAFVQRIGTDATSAQIVHVIVELARTFGLQTVAEGIETDDIHDALRDLGVELGQGFLMSRPVPAADLADILRSGYRAMPSPEDLQLMTV